MPAWRFAMPRSVEAVVPMYFFNQRVNDVVGVDAVGLDLPDLDAVRRRATELAREIMSDQLLQGEVVLDRSIEVTDPVGHVVLSLPFTEVARLRLPSSSGRRDHPMPPPRQ
jgi:hypothetical protein